MAEMDVVTVAVSVFVGVGSEVFEIAREVSVLLFSSDCS